MRRICAIAIATFLLACGGTSDGNEDDGNGAGGEDVEQGGANATGGSDGGAGGGGVGGGATPADGWPLGIPMAPFGIDEEAGAYTHYVDNTHPACADDTDGTEAAPRCTMPKTVDAGAVVEIHGGPYLIPSNSETYVLSGTENEPVFFRGVGSPVMDGNDDNAVMHFQGTYFIVEGLVFANGTSARLENGSFQALRHSEVDEAERTCLLMNGDYGVAYNNDLHHCHDGGKDRHGVQVGQGTTHNWIIGNHIHHTSSNGIQYTHGAEASPPDFVFIGGNVLNHNRETGVATKWAGRSIVSQNHVYGVERSQVGVEWCVEDGVFCMTPESATNGPGIHIGADGHPEEKWVIFNVIHDAQHCIRVEDGERLRIVGNLCANIEMSGINLEKSGDDLVIAHNTFFDVARQGTAGIHQYWRDQFAVDIRNNLFVTTGAAALWFESSTVASTVVFDNNLLYNAGSPFAVRWVNQTTDIASATELEALLSSAAQVQNNRVEDPGVTLDTSSSMPVVVRAPSSPTLGQADDVLSELDAELKGTFGDEVTIIPETWAQGAAIGAP